MTGFLIDFNFLRGSVQKGSNTDSFVVNFGLALGKGLGHFCEWFWGEDGAVFADLRKWHLDTRPGKGLK
jgi:hypothetical protein